MTVYPRDHDHLSGQSHGHAHGHFHAHDHGPASGVSMTRAFRLAVGLNAALVLVQVVVGFMSSSVALLADAGHNLADVGGLLLAWGASILARRPPTKRRTYGYRGSTILAALFNAVILMATAGALGWESIHRFWSPAAGLGSGMVMWAAGAGILVNTVSAFLFIGGKERDLNVRGAFLHLIADAGVSVAVLLGAYAAQTTGAMWIDPALGLLIVGLIIYGTWGTLTESLNLALSAVPRHIDLEKVQDFLLSQAGVSEVHDLHIWSMSTTEVILTAHLVMPHAPAAKVDELLGTLTADLKNRFAIGHATLQIETGAEGNCALAPQDVV